MIKPRPTPTCGPLWRVPLDERGKIRIRDDAGVLHRLRGTGIIQQIASSFDARDKQERARNNAQLALSMPGTPAWLRKPLLITLIAIFGGFALFLLFAAASSPRQMLPGLLTMLPGIVFFLFMQRWSRYEQDRRRCFTLIVRRLLEGHCAVCDYELDQASPGAGNHTLCAECGAIWDVRAWQSSFLIPATTHAKHDPLPANSRAASAAVFGTPTDLERAKALARSTWRHAKEYMAREAWGYIRSPSLALVLCAACVLASPLFWPLAAANATDAREAMLMRASIVALPLALTTMLVWIHARERAIAIIHAHRRGNNRCEHCEAPLAMVPCHADRTILCHDCGARRSLDITLPS